MKAFFAKNKLLTNSFILAVLFALSVVVRVNNLKAPMGRHHEWLTGHVLTTLNIWEKNGITNHYFSPVWRFNNKADLQMISDQAFKDKRGYNYYVSYPPFCFILPYLVTKLTFTDVSVIGIRIFGLLNHFFCALLILLIINRIFNKSLRSDFFLPSIIGFAIYLFASGNLWFHTNVYFADMLVHLFVLWGLYLFIGILEDPEENKRTKMIFLFITTFFGVYTEWIALFIAFYMGVFLFLKCFKTRAYIKYILILTVAAILPICITIAQYSQIAGFELLKEQSVSKYKSRSGYDKSTADGGFTIDRPISKARISNHYETNYEELLDYAWLCLYFVLALIILNGFDKRTQLKRSHLIIFAILISSIFTHHFIFFNFTVVHDFSTLKSSMLLVLFIAYVLGLFMTYITSIRSKTIIGSAMILVSVWFIHLSLQKYYRVNRQDPISYCEQAIGDAVKKYSSPDDVIFTDVFVTPVLFWYSERNVIQVNNLSECVWFLNNGKCKTGLFIKAKKGQKDFVLEGIKMTMNGDSLKVF